MRGLVERFGIAWPTYGDWVAAAAALVLVNRIWQLFKENGIDIPFPQRDLRDPTA